MRLAGTPAVDVAAIFDELLEHARCLHGQLADPSKADRLRELAQRGRDAATDDERLAAARVSRLVLDEIAADERAGLLGDTLRQCDACLDRLDRPLTPHRST